MTRLLTVVAAVGSFLVLAVSPVAGAEHLRFNPGAQLDTTQVIDLREVS